MRRIRRGIRRTPCSCVLVRGSFTSICKKMGGLQNASYSYSGLTWPCPKSLQSFVIGLSDASKSDMRDCNHFTESSIHPSIHPYNPESVGCADSVSSPKYKVAQCRITIILHDFCHRDTVIPAKRNVHGLHCSV